MQNAVLFFIPLLLYKRYVYTFIRVFIGLKWLQVIEKHNFDNKLFVLVS